MSGTAISTLTNSATDSESGESFTWSATGLPAGLSIDPASGSISGTPTAAGNGTVTLTATDSAGSSGSTNIAWTVTNTVTVGSVGDQNDVSGSPVPGVANSATDTQAGETVAWSATGLPAGLSVDPSSGTIGGTPTTAGVFHVTVTATDGAGYSGSTSFTWTITNVVGVTGPGAQTDVSGTDITPVAVPGTDSSSSAVLTFSDGGTLPPGLSVDQSTGIVSGSPSTAGTYEVTITVSDTGSYSASTTFSWTITNTVSVENPGTLASLSGSPIAIVTPTATDSSSTATIASWSATGLPTGLAINSTTGAISGTPTTAGANTVTLTATDDAGFSGSTTFTWYATNTMTATSPGNQTGTSGTAITPVTVSATDSSSTATVSFTATGLPTGLAIDLTTGTISGTPTTAGTYSVTVTAADNAGSSASTEFTWTVVNTVSVTGPGNQTGTSGTAITPVTVSATDSSSTATVSFTATGLPAGLAINPTTGAISGTPTTAGTHSVTVTATDNAGYSASTGFGWTVVNTVSVTGPGAQSGHVGTAITPVHVTASDSSTTTSLTYSATGLPAGLSIAPSTGTITGTPTRSGIDSVTVTATDGAGFTGSTTFGWSVVGPTITSISVRTGPASGGTKVSIVGTGLTGVTAVSFGGTPATAIKANGKGTKVTVVSPAHTGGTVDIIVTTVVGPTLPGSADEFTYTPPSITSLSPASGPATGGTTVHIVGTGLKGATVVSFGTVHVTSFTVSGTGGKITVKAPPGTAGTVDVTVTTPEGTTAIVTGDHYTYG